MLVRSLGCGWVCWQDVGDTFVASGAGNPQAPIPGIDPPMLFRRSLMAFQDRAGKAS